MKFDDLFRLTPRGPGQWSAPGAPPTDERMVFGGLVIGQAIVAASIETRRCHALHAFFIGAGQKQEPFDLSVVRIRDGGSFSTRFIQIHQGERLLLSGLSSHHDGDPGPEHQIAMPDTPPPDSVEDFYLLRTRRSTELEKPPRHYLIDRLLDVRRVHQSAPDQEPMQRMWFRARQPIQGDATIHQAAIGFASDVGPVQVGLQNHPRNESQSQLQTASLDHSLWFHQDARADEWMLLVMRSPQAGNGRGLSLGSIFNARGQLVASVAQEFLARTGRPKPAG